MLFLGLGLGLVLGAQAHSRLIESVPADGAVLAAAPTTIVLRFDGLVEPALGRMVLEREPPVVLVRLTEGADAREAIAALPPLAPGAHRITWRVVSRDGHPVTGELRFVVQAR